MRLQVGAGQFCSKLLTRSSLGRGGRSIVQNYIEQGAVDLESAFCSSGIVDEAQFSEAIHEKADSRSGGSDHFGERFLAHFWDDRLGNPLLTEVSQ